MNLFRTKPVTLPDDHTTTLRRCLNAFDLTLLGIGAIIGAGIFVITGVAAATHAGPGISVSYVVAGLASLFAALAYAELASSIGGCGSAYHYAYSGFGEIVAWVIGWDLLLEYLVTVSTVAIGWSGYVNNILQSLDIHLPDMLLKGPLEGGAINLLAISIILILAMLLYMGVKESTRFNAIMVFIKLLTITTFIVVASGNINFHFWKNFLPFGWTGVMHGAALVFFAYLGFDAVSTTAEEAINPSKTLPIGIIASLLICTIIYLVVASLLTLIVPYYTLNSKSPVSESLLALNHPIIASLIAAGAVAGITTVMLVTYYGFSRIFLAMARDGMLPTSLAKIHPRRKTPSVIIFSSAIFMSLVAGFLPIGEAAELVNIGTLAAFTFVCGGVIILRRTRPTLPRPFKLPLNPLFPSLGILFCIALAMNLPAITWWRFVLWMFIGMVIYFLYGRKHSVLNVSA